MSQVFRPLDPLVIVTAENGKTEIPSSTPLTRLHYFDGKFLRADDLSLDQAYVRALVHLSSQAGGSGIVHGLDTTLSGSGDEIVIGPGMAIDPAGRVLLLPNAERRFRIDELIPLTARAVLSPRTRFLGPGSFEACVVTSEAPTVKPSDGYNFYVITLGHAEGLCGQEDVYGKLCEEACITSTDRPYYREGVIVRAEPLRLTTAMPTSGVVVLQELHLRSRLASAAFADEETHVGTLISGAGLRSHGWCLGARLGSGGRVPLAVMARAGATTVFLDAWTVRRERMEPPPRRYWAGRMSMRPWDVFLAQVLQFQCQINQLFQEPGTVVSQDPCRDVRDAVREASKTIGSLADAVRQPLPRERLAGLAAAPMAKPTLSVPLAHIADLQLKLDKFLRPPLRPQRNGVLVDGGIIELPPAGYLPVDNAAVVNDQVIAMLGRGVDLRFCRVTADFVGHALEEAQHMDRISLLEGLEPGGTRPPVDILIPDGEVIKTVVPGRGIGFEAELHVRPDFSLAGPVQPARLTTGPGAASGPAAGIKDMGDLGDRLREVADEMRDRMGKEPTFEPIKPRPTASTVEVLGAGRAERFESGGGAFYFAGTSDAPHQLKIADFVRALGAIGRSDALDDLKLWHKFPTAAVSERPGGVDAAMYRNANTIGGRAVLFTSGLRGGFPGLVDDILRPPIAELPDFEIPTPATEKRIVTTWTAMRADQNPFLLGVDGTTRVDLQFTVGMPGKKASWIDYRVQGEFTVTRHQHAASIEQLSGYVHDGSAHTRLVLEGAAPVDQHDTGDIGVQCQLESTFRQQKLTVQVRHGKLNAFRIEVTWDETPLQAHVEVTYEQRGNFAETTLLSGDLRRNDAVLAAGHPRHALAVSAVNVTAALIKRPEFSGQALARLFPTPPPAPVEVKYRATRDWVFFHRRRIKECGGGVERPMPAPARRYHVWQLEVPDVGTANQIRQALLTNDVAGLPALAPITTVEFSGGLSTLAPNVQDLRRKWLEADRGNILQYSLIASQGTLDGDLLARMRADQVEHALAPGLVPDAHALTDVIPFVPGPLTVPETDGAIVLLTRREVKTTCHNVYRIYPHYAQRAIALLKEQKIAELAADRIAVNIGRLEFKGDSAEFVTGPAERQQVLANWDSSGDGRPGRVMGFANSADAVASREPQLTDRVKAIGALLRNEQGSVTAEAVPAAMPGGCAGATFVIPAVTGHLVVVIDKNLSGVKPTVPTMLGAGALADILKYATPLGDAMFLSGTGNQVPGSSLQLLSSVFPGAAAAEVFIYSQPGATPETALVLQAQGGAISSGVGAPSLPVAVPAVTASGWPDAKYLHVTVIAVQAARLTQHLVVAIDKEAHSVDPSVPTALRTGQLDGILKHGQRLGEALFQSGSATVAAPLVLEALTAVFPGITTADVFVYSQPGGTPEPATVLEAQCGAIGTAVGAARWQMTVATVAATGWPGASYQHVTVIAITQRSVAPTEPGGKIPFIPGRIPLPGGGRVPGGAFVPGGGTPPVGGTVPGGGTTPIPGGPQGGRRPASPRSPRTPAVPAQPTSGRRPRGRRKPKPPND